MDAEYACLSSDAVSRVLNGSLAAKPIPEATQHWWIQNLLFSGGLAYSQDAGVLNRSNSSLLNVLEAMSCERRWLVGPPGLEPGANGL
jgi:hypothetical protein